MKNRRRVACAAGAEQFAVFTAGRPQAQCYNDKAGCINPDRDTTSEPGDTTEA